jgi:hypothetical protein
VREVSAGRIWAGQVQEPGARHVADVVVVVAADSEVAGSKARSPARTGGLMSITPVIGASSGSRLARVKS